MLNLWGYGDVLTSIGQHPVAYVVAYVGVNLAVTAVVSLFKVIAKGLRQSA